MYLNEFSILFLRGKLGMFFTNTPELARVRGEWLPLCVTLKINFVPSVPKPQWRILYLRSLLIIEDDPAILKELEESFEEENYRVLTAQDGVRGYEMAWRENIDVMMLPGKNGQDVCHDLRSGGWRNTHSDTH